MTCATHHGSPYSHVFDIPLAKPARGRRKTPDVFRTREHAAMADLEFSDVGRNPRFAPGWFILPGIAWGLAVIAALILLL